MSIVARGSSRKDEPSQIGRAALVVVAEDMREGARWVKLCPLAAFVDSRHRHEFPGLSALPTNRLSSDSRCWHLHLPPLIPHAHLLFLLVPFSSMFP